MPVQSLKNQREFNLVSKQSRKFYAENFLLVYNSTLPTNFYPNSEAIFLGAKVGKKLGKAVVRNKIKRRIRHIIRIIAEISQGSLKRVGLIIIPRKGFEKIKFLDIQKAFQKILIHPSSLQ